MIARTSAKTRRAECFIAGQKAPEVIEPRRGLREHRPVFEVSADVPRHFSGRCITPLRIDGEGLQNYGIQIPRQARVDLAGCVNPAFDDPAHDIFSRPGRLRILPG